MRINPDADLDPQQQDEHENDHGPLSKPLLSMIQSLLTHLHKTEPTENNFVIFGPNRASLEQIQQQQQQQQHQNNKDEKDLEFIILDDRSMQGDLKTLYDNVCRNASSLPTEGDQPCGLRRRRVWLATPLFQSGIYFAGVKCVVDLCRSMAVVEQQPEDDTSSNNNKKNKNNEKVVWASQAACDQRQGRAMEGGQTFRLVDRGFYLSRFPKDEPPRQPPKNNNSNHRCSNELLRLLYSPTVKDPRGLLHEASWHSSGANIHQAVTHLRQIKAIERSSPESYDSLRLTQYGKLLAALPLDNRNDNDDDMADARTVVRGAQLGLLHETVAFVAAQRHPPLGSIADWYQNPCNDKMQFFANTSPALAQLAAYMFWESEWRYAEQRRHQNQSVFFHETSHCQEPTAFRWTAETEKLHEDWCQLHAINPSAVLLIANVVDETIRTLFSSSFEPDWLRCTDPQPRWVRQRQGTGSGQRQDMLTRVYGLEAAVVGQALVALAEDKDEIPLPFLTNDEEVACVHFLMGYCKYGTLCRNSHSRNAIRPPCRFHLAGFCTKGDQCPYSHEVSEQKRVADRCSDPMLSLVPVMKQLFVQGGPLGWYQRNYPHVLLLGEGHFTFTSSLEYLGYPPYLATSNIFDSTFLDIPNRWKGVDATRLHLDQRVLQQTSIGKVQSFAWNFPSFGVDHHNDHANENLLLECFHSIALVRSMIPFLRPVKFQFAVVLHSDQFSRWNLLRSANLTGWRLSGWAPFNASVFPGYFPSKLNGEAISCDSARFYVFSLPVDRTVLRP